MSSHFTTSPADDGSDANKSSPISLPSSKGPRCCGRRLQMGHVMWKCLTCRLEVAMLTMLNENMGIMCEQCFKGSNHEGHDVVECCVKSKELFCDCGDIVCWNVNGCCADHCPMEEKPLVAYLQQNHPISLETYSSSLFKQLDLNKKRIGGAIGAEGAKALGDAFCTSECLRVLDLNMNEIGDDGTKAIAEAIRINTTLIHLSLTFNDIRAGGAKSLGEALYTDARLIYLNLNNNKIGDEGAMELGKALSVNDTLTNIGLDSNYIGAEGAKVLGEALLVNTTLLQLDLGYNNIGDEGVRALGQALFTNNTLFHLSLIFNDIRDDGAKALGKALSTNSSVTNLKLNNNGIGAEGAKAFGQALCANNTLTSLHLYGNEINNEGAKALGEALLTNAALTNLHLDNNFIGPDGAKAFGKALCLNTTLELLDLNINEIGDEGAKAFGEALISNTSLTNIDINNNGIGAVGAKALIEGLKKNDGMINIQFDHSIIYDEMRFIVLPLLKENKTMGNHLRFCKNSISFYVDVKESCNTSNEEVGNNFNWHYLKNKDIRINKHDGAIPEGEQIWEAAKGSGKVLRVFHHLLLKFFLEPNKNQELVTKNEENRFVEVKEIYNKRRECIIALIDGKTNKEGSTLLHVAAALESMEAFELCKYLVQLGADFDKVLDPLGRSARDIAVANSNPHMVEWARAFGTFLGRYKFYEGPPVHRSATCTVNFATDVKVPKSHEHRVVAIKIMEKKEPFQRELERRVYNPEPHSIGLDKDVAIDDNIFDEDHVVPILRYHTGIIDGKEVRCLVMPKGERNFSQIIDSERIAGDDLNKIYFFVRDICYAVQHIHKKGRMIHGDLKPRNIIRLRGNYKLIDFDASVLMGRDPSEKKSTGYVPPEYARRLFFKNDDIEQLKKELRKQAAIVKNIDPLDDSYGQVSKRLEQLKQQLKQLGEEKSRQVFTHSVFDVWGLGMLLYTLFTGEYIFLLDRDDNIIKEEDKMRLMNWEGLTCTELEKVLSHADSEAQREAKDLLSICLEKDATKRFQSLDDMLRHTLFTGKIDEGYRQIMLELKENRKVITNAIFEANEVNTPTRFILLPYRLQWNEQGQLFLPSSIETEEFKKTLVNLQNTSAILYLLNEKCKRSKEKYRELLQEFDKLHKTNKREAVEKLFEFIGISSSASETEIDLDELEGFWIDPLKALKANVKSTRQKWLSKYKSQKSYLYLLDEYYLTPVVSDGSIYPIEIEQASKYLQNLVPFMRLGIYSISMLCAVAAIFSLPICLPEYMTKSALDKLDRIEKDSSVEDFEVIQSELSNVRGNEEESNLADSIQQSKSLRGAELRHLGIFFDVFDKNRDYAGLRRCYDKTGTAYWTTAPSEEINGFVVNETRSITWFEAMMKRELQKKDVQIEEKEAQVREKNAQIQQLLGNQPRCKSCCIS